MDTSPDKIKAKAAALNKIVRVDKLLQTFENKKVHNIEFYTSNAPEWRNGIQLLEDIANKFDYDHSLHDKIIQTCIDWLHNKRDSLIKGLEE